MPKRTDDEARPLGTPDLPAGWLAIPSVGWPGTEEDSSVWTAVMSPDRQTRIGNVMVPTTFRLDVFPRERKNDDEEDRRMDGPLVQLCYRAHKGEVFLAQVVARGVEVTQALDLLRTARPVEWWKRYAFTSLVLRLANAAYALTGALSGAVIDTSPGSEYAAWQAATDETVIAASASLIPSRRNRLTDEHLTQVAEVYREAWASGSPPTKAVAEKFNVSHSTAARWVGIARRGPDAKLGPADSSRGGERPNSKASPRRPAGATTKRSKGGSR